MEEHTSRVIFGISAAWIATLIFVVVYGLVISEKINRAILALLGAGLLILTGVLTQEAALRGVDFNTIGLLLGMMVIVNITGRSGVFQYVAIWSAKKVDARPAGVLIMLSAVTAVFSAMLDNVTTVLLVVPVTILITEELKVNSFPFLVSEILSSNIGGTATLIGDPPNIMIGSAVGLTFNQFVANLAPVIVVIEVVTLAIFMFLWRNSLIATREAMLQVMQFKEIEALKDTRLLKQSLFVITLVIIGFMTAHSLHLEPATIAIFGAALLLLMDNLRHSPEHQSEKVHQAFASAEWVTLLFFVGLFILVHGLESAGVIRWMAQLLLDATGGNFNTTAVAVLWASAILSAFIDNIPFVATMIPMIKSMAPVFGGEQALVPLWWALSLGACLGGNGTLIGASANLVVAGLSERAGHPIRFIPYMKASFLLMLMSIAFSNIYLYYRYL